MPCLGAFDKPVVPWTIPWSHVKQTSKCCQRKYPHPTLKKSPNYMAVLRFSTIFLYSMTQTKPYLSLRNELNRSCDLDKLSTFSFPWFPRMLPVLNVYTSSRAPLFDYSSRCNLMQFQWDDCVANPLNSLKRHLRTPRGDSSTFSGSLLEHPFLQTSSNWPGLRERTGAQLWWLPAPTALYVGKSDYCPW